MSNATEPPTDTAGPVVRVDPERCNDCGYCLDNCPHDVLEMSTETNSRGFRFASAVRLEDCTGCGLCAIGCPQIAIEVRDR